MLENAELVLVGANDAPWYWWDHSGWYWAMGLHGIFWLILIALIVVTIVAPIRSSRRGPAGTDRSAKSAMDTRYARGEINRSEYLERKRDLA
jgi:putative membrane protein